MNQDWGIAVGLVIVLWTIICSIVFNISWWWVIDAIVSAPRIFQVIGGPVVLITGFWILLRVYAYYFDNPAFGVVLGKSASKPVVEVTIMNNGSKTYRLDSVEFLYDPNNISLEGFSDFNDRTYTSGETVPHGLPPTETYDPLRTESWEFHHRYFDCGDKGSRFRCPPDSRLNIDVKMHDEVIHILYIRVIPYIEASELVPFLPQFFNTLYGPFRVQRYEERYEQLTPRIWDRQSPSSLDDHSVEWPIIE